MLDAQNQRSEVARLLAQITQEYDAAKSGMSGLASGTARHDFITKRMEQMGEIHTQLSAIVGETEAIALIGQQIEQSPL